MELCGFHTELEGTGMNGTKNTAKKTIDEYISDLKNPSLDIRHIAIRIWPVWRLGS